MGEGLFSTYRTGENRVTASIVAVLRSLALSRTQRLLSALTEDSRLELVAFRNQIAVPGRPSVPDAEILGSCRLLLETKVTRNAVRLDQVNGHLQHLDGSTEAFQGLLVLTPDEARPKALIDHPDARVYWASFTALDQSIDELLMDKMEVISEREAYLLRELQRMLVEEGLLGFAKDTVIVAAKRAWSVYQQWHAYLCQPDRPFQPVQYLGFYVDGQVLPVIPRILEVHDRVVLEPGQQAGRLGAVVKAVLDTGARARGDEQKIFLLSAPHDPQTVVLPAPIPNDLRSSAGRVSAFTMGQRYVRVEDLRRAARTSDLVAANP